jgi:hypothetical protein
MSLLYGGSYKARFRRVCNYIGQADVVELCFGDIFIASFCKKNRLHWTGYDINNSFVKHAQKKGYHAILADITTIDKFQDAEICLMMGSFYQFFDNFEEILKKMLDCSNRVIISEPIKNLSGRNDVIGSIAKRSANAGRRVEDFRFTEKTLIEILDKCSEKFNFKYQVDKRLKKDIIIAIEK